MLMVVIDFDSVLTWGMMMMLDVFMRVPGMRPFHRLSTGMVMRRPARLHRRYGQTLHWQRHCRQPGDYAFRKIEIKHGVS